MVALNETHDPKRHSWVESAQKSDTDFPIQNLPFGIFRRRGSTETWRGGVAIGDLILDLSRLRASGIVDGLAAEALAAAADSSLNRFMGLGNRYWSALRRELSGLLAANSRVAKERHAELAPFLMPQADAELTVPALVGDYSDFFTSYHHALNSGRINRPHQVLSSSFKHIPIGYHGRASTIIVSGTSVRRPLVQTREGAIEAPEFGACRMLDYEGELAFYIGPGNPLGETISIDRIQDHLFGCSILNDWTARDAQTWEKFGSGPMLAKDFATSVSPWVVTMEALAPFRVPAFKRPQGDPKPFPYLSAAYEEEAGGIDITVEVFLRTDRMRQESTSPHRLSRASFNEQYFTIGQMAAHHASNGCVLRPGDILGSGTVSNAASDSWGCMMEQTHRGKNPLTLGNSETRAFLADGDEVIMRAGCVRSGFVSIGMGECVGRILPSKP